MNFFKIIIVIFLSCLLDWSHFWNQGSFKVSFLNVEQGDAAIIRTPTNCTMLIDGGPKQELAKKIKKYVPLSERDIDLIVLTHPHLDHLAGILELEHRFNFKNIWLTGVDYNLLEYEQLLLQLDPNITNISYINNYAEYNMCGVKITILQPTNSQIGATIKNVNNSSIVLLIEIKDKKILFTGDAEIEQEAELIKEYSETLPKLDILKAGHHGSKTSTTPELLEIVRPDYLVISAGKDNTYGHPHLETIKKADLYNIEILRTDQLDDINFFF